MSNMKLSIVIPIYKVEKYIEKCLESCINQDVELGVDYEIICINDGTPDKSADIAKDIARKHKGIIVYDQENQGLSAARNKGLSLAQGEYVWFVDSDDWIEPNCLSKLFPYLENKLDFLEIQYEIVYEDGSTKQGEKSCCATDVRLGRDVILQGGVHTAAQFCILRREFLYSNKLEFVKGIYHEDVEFKIRTLLMAERVTSTPDVCYNYLQRTSGSITSHFKLKNAKDIMFVLGNHFKFVQQYDKDVQRAIYCKIAMWLNDVFLGMRELNKEDYDEVTRMIKSNKYLVKAMLHTRKIKYVMEGILLSINVNMGLRIHKKIR